MRFDGGFRPSRAALFAFPALGNLTTFWLGLNPTLGTFIFITNRVSHISYLLFRGSGRTRHVSRSTGYRSGDPCLEGGRSALGHPLSLSI